MMEESLTPQRSPRPHDEALAGGERAYVSEIFASVQGEGPYLGERQVFVRTAGCSATCSWCDTVYSKVQTPRCVIHGDDKAIFDNPVALRDVLESIRRLAAAQAPVHSVSITGGEPLEQPAFVERLSAGLKAGGMKVYLETNGVHAEALDRVSEHVDVVAMDIKLPSAIGLSAWEEHQAFLRCAVESGTDVFVKIVVDNASQKDEIDTASQMIAAVDRNIPLILQPESGALLSERTPRTETGELLRRLDEFQRAALERLSSVRVIPQCHKILKVR